MTLLLDAETFDYGGDGSSLGEGFKIAVVHPMDLGVMESMAINVDIGTVTNVGVSTTLINITSDAVTSFNPYERKCWMEKEIALRHFPSVDYRCVLNQFNRPLTIHNVSQNPLTVLVPKLPKISRYGIYNCLMEAAMQEGYRKCSCYPGYLRPSNNSCQGESLSCFKHVLSHLGHIQYIIATNT